MSSGSIYRRQDRSGPGSGMSAERASTSSHPRPGLPELVVGLGVWSVAAFVLLPQLRLLGLDPAVHGLILTAMSGVIGLLSFTVAYLLRSRSLAAFGVRRVRGRWIAIGIAAGIVTLVVKSLASGAWIMVSGDTSNPQSQYAQAAGGGVVFLVLATVFLGLLTPLGEELLFRAVVATVLLRYGAVAGVGGSALVFALFHGINSVFPGAFVIGLATAELYRRTGSIWPGVVVHVVVNLPAPIISVLAGLG